MADDEASEFDARDDGFVRLFPSQPSAPSNDIDVAPPHEEDDEDATPHDDHEKDATPSFEPDIALGGVGF